MQEESPENLCSLVGGGTLTPLHCNGVRGEGKALHIFVDICPENRVPRIGAPSYEVSSLRSKPSEGGSNLL